MAKKKQKSASPAQGADGETAEKKSGGIVSKAVMLVALGAASFGTVFLLPRPGKAPQPDASHESAEGHETAEPLDLDEATGYLELNPMTITLQDGMRILKIGITLETLSGEEAYIDPNDPKIRDAFMGYLRALRVEQIQDAAFMAQMRAQLLRRAQLILGPEKVRGILITDFLVR